MIPSYLIASSYPELLTIELTSAYLCQLVFSSAIYFYLAMFVQLGVHDFQVSRENYRAI